MSAPGGVEFRQVDHCLIYGLTLTLVNGNRPAQGERQLLLRFLLVIVPRGTPQSLYGSDRGIPWVSRVDGPCWSGVPVEPDDNNLGKDRILLSWVLLLLCVAAVNYILNRDAPWVSRVAGPCWSGVPVKPDDNKLGEGRILLSWVLLLLCVAAVNYILKCLIYAALIYYYCRGHTPTVFMLSLYSR